MSIPILTEDARTYRRPHGNYSVADPSALLCGFVAHSVTMRTDAPAALSMMANWSSRISLPNFLCECSPYNEIISLDKARRQAEARVERLAGRAARA